MKIKVNGTPYYIKPLSKLTFTEFNNIMVKGKCTDLKSYISLFVNMPIADFMKSEMRGVALPVLAEYIFDVDVNKVVKDKKHTVKLNNKLKTINNSPLLVGQEFLITIINSKLRDKEINEYEHSLWLLAVSMLDHEHVADMGKAEEYYNDLASQEWVKVMPQSFFLLKRIIKPRVTMWRQSIAYMLGLKKINTMIRISKKLLKSTAAKVQYSYFVKYSTKMKMQY